MRGPYSDGALTENDAAATAMALLAFLGDGHTHKSGEYAAEVEKGIKFLVSMQDRSGFFAKSSRSHEKMYAQAQATIAICELYGMTKHNLPWTSPCKLSPNRVVGVMSRSLILIPASPAGS
jgi:hypothetical protein